jgi:hypothetical protein
MTRKGTYPPRDFQADAIPHFGDNPHEADHYLIQVDGQPVTTQQERHDAHALTNAYRRPAKSGYSVETLGARSLVVTRSSGVVKGEFHDPGEAEKIAADLNERSSRLWTDKGKRRI